MKKNRTLDRNQIVVVCLFAICVLLIFLIFFISNHTAETQESVSAYVTCQDVEDAYAFLKQDEAVQRALAQVSSEEVFTYADYQNFLEELHLWDAGDFEKLLGWDAKGEQAVSPEILKQSSEMVAELFEMTETEKDVSDEQEVSEAVSTVPQIDEQTKVHVLLLQNGDPLAKNIWFSANDTYSISWKGKTKNKKKNQVIRASQLRLELGQTATIGSEHGQVYLANAQGERTSLCYYGSFQITRYEGGYAIVNEVGIEDYLYGVVQSEMPAYFEKEALKAQAVCARTYIVTQLMQQDNYSQYGADVDDSVNYQVYNQASPDERVVEAVDATKGLILEANGLPIHTYFFSTSHGVTSGREIWELPQLDYLQPVRGNLDAKVPDLSDEETFRAYIRETNADDYDVSGRYYRWKVTLDISNHLEAVKSLLCRIDETQPDDIIIKNSSGQTIRAKEMSDWKEAVQLKVLKRSGSGAVLRLQITFSEGEVVLSNESFIRQILGIWISSLQDKDGNFISAGEMLPSAYFYVQPIKKGIVLFGGGYGHGIGMSQYGADGMAKQGADMEDILSFYYQNVDLTQLYANENQYISEDTT